ncbi:methyltransferase-domain-containing protein [Halteromyces radiatus]|uniref:methyltransferase-domain-containing protein n=1 Tax=Halteromyces radiatus TaxID=101107 RepID=UPI002220CEF7|nr:methyltransferase-domain-containing protein [Halteromyces radiatus]KAI8100041.1 methyltransferase-domain-containing protein [Halteromyces radiatus]
MQPLFQTSGWTLPANVAPEIKKKQNKDIEQSTTKTTKDADQIQAQFNQLGPKKTKNQKKRERQKNADQQVNSKKPKLDKAKSPSPQKQPSDKNQIQQKQPNKKINKQQVTTKEHQNKQVDNESKDQDKTMTPVSSNTSDNIKPKKMIDANKKNKLKALLGKNKTAPIVKEDSSAPTKKENKANVQNSNKQLTAPKNEPRLTPLQQKMKDKLSGARFRWLNEKLYTTEGNEAFSLFQEQPELFDEYHEGFRHQVESWPVNPVDLILEQLEKTPKGTVIADLGCGDAVIAHTLKKQNVLSYDLIAKNDKVIACDITKLPLSDNKVDVVVFSLSLMGTNYLDFLKEAQRILKPGGEMKIAEVVSRFSDIDAFIDLVETIGFDFMEKDDNNKMFIMLYFTKRHESISMENANEEMMEGLSKHQKRMLQQGTGGRVNINKLRKKSQNLLKPCLYKRR